MSKQESAASVGSNGKSKAPRKAAPTTTANGLWARKRMPAGDITFPAVQRKEPKRKPVEAAIRRTLSADQSSPLASVVPPGQATQLPPPDTAQEDGGPSAPLTGEPISPASIPVVLPEGSLAIPEAGGGRLSDPAPGGFPLEVSGEKKLTPERAKEIRKLRKHYGKRLPSLVCDNCAHVQQCPHFKAGFECAFLGVIGGTRIEDTEDAKELQKRIIEANVTTAELGLIQQRLAGGVIDQQTSNRLDMAFEQLAEFRRADMQEKLSKPLGTDKLTIEGSGLIETLFGNLGRAKIIDVKPESISKPPEREDASVQREIVNEKDKEFQEALALLDRPFEAVPLKSKDGEGKGPEEKPSK